ncbi:MAG: hypothetical protein ACXVEF_00850 [Polyangiales bacterium]
MSSGAGKSKDPEADEETVFDAPRVSLPSDDDDNMPTIALEGTKPLLKPPPPKAPAPKPVLNGISPDTPLGASGEVTMDSQQVAFDVLARAAFGKKPAAAPAPASPPAASGGDFESTQYLVASSPSASMQVAKPVAPPVAPLAPQVPSVVVEAPAQQVAKRPPPPPIVLIVVAAVMGLAIVGLAVFLILR